MAGPRGPTTAAGEAAFVVVAGGLGERLGYEGIKLSLPSEVTPGVVLGRAGCTLPKIGRGALGGEGGGRGAPTIFWRAL